LLRLIFVALCCNSTVGHAGASGLPGRHGGAFIQHLAIGDEGHGLVLNILGRHNWHHSLFPAGFFSWQTFWPFVVIQFRRLSLARIDPTGSNTVKRRILVNAPSSSALVDDQRCRDIDGYIDGPRLLRWNRLGSMRRQ